MKERAAGGASQTRHESSTSTAVKWQTSHARLAQKAKTNPGLNPGGLAYT